MKKMIKKNNGTFKKCFAQRLRELRKENGITQAGLAERMNVSRIGKAASVFPRWRR